MFTAWPFCDRYLLRSSKTDFFALYLLNYDEIRKVLPEMSDIGSLIVKSEQIFELPHRKKIWETSSSFFRISISASVILHDTSVSQFLCMKTQNLNDVSSRRDFELQ